MPLLHNSYDYNACSFLNCVFKINDQKSIINDEKRVIIYVNHTIQKMQYQLHDGIFTCALYKNYVPFDQEFFFK